jgi:opacity protein-like surface antigen
VKKLLTGCCLALAAVLATPAPSWCQVYGQFTGAQPLEVNTRLAGGYLTSSSNVFGLLAQLRLSFYPGIDFGFQGGFARQSFKGGDRTTLRLGTDLKYEIIQPTEDAPYSVAVGGGLGVETGDHWNVFSVGPSAVASRTFAGNGQVQFTPFVGAGILFTNINVDPLNDTDISMPVRVGSELRLNPQISLTAELQLRLSDSFNDDVGVAVGINSPF